MGLMRNIVVVDYQPNWPALFQAESAFLSQALQSVLVSLHHIGSTSVPGLPAKPVIDMLAEVRSLEALDACNPAMQQLGYEPRGELGIAGRRYFSKGGDERRSHHLHAFATAHPGLEKHLVFRDYFRVHSQEATRYAHLKRQLAQAHPDDIEAYMAGKAPLIAELLEQAHQWRKSLPSVGN